MDMRFIAIENIKNILVISKEDTGDRYMIPVCIFDTCSMRRVSDWCYVLRKDKTSSDAIKIGDIFDESNLDIDALVSEYFDYFTVEEACTVLKKYKESSIIGEIKVVSVTTTEYGHFPKEMIDTLKSDLFISHGIDIGGMVETIVV